MYNNIRKNGIVGVVETDNLIPVNLHFSEWWSGEGLDLNFLNEKNKSISLHMDEIETLTIAAFLCGMIDIKEIKKQAKRIEEDSLKREEELLRLRDEYQANQASEFGSKRTSHTKISSKNSKKQKNLQ